MYLQDDIISELVDFDAKNTIIRYSKKELVGRSAQDLVIYTFGSSIYRAFSYEGPLKQYREWSISKDPALLIEQLKSVTSQISFNDLLYATAESLLSEWRPLKNNGTPTYMNIGIALKIVNILFKHLSYSEYVKNDIIFEFLHVPWDKYTLHPLRSIWQYQPGMPKEVTMRFVSDIGIYQKLHQLISSIAEQASCPRIHYEFWAWNQYH